MRVLHRCISSSSSTWFWHGVEEKARGEAVTRGDKLALGRLAELGVLSVDDLVPLLLLLDDGSGFAFLELRVVAGVVARDHTISPISVRTAAARGLGGSADAFFSRADLGLGGYTHDE